MSPEDLALLSLFVSVAAFAVAATTLYQHHLRPASISVVAGEHLSVYHSSDGTCGISLPIALANAGAKATSVRRVGLLLQETNANSGYLFEPHLYEKVDDNGNSKTESLAVPIPIAGKGVTTRQVLFRSARAPGTEFQLVKPGNYTVSVLVWIESSTEPHAADSFSIVVSDVEAATLHSSIASKSTLIVQLRQSYWSKWSAHRVTEVELEALRRRPGQSAG